MPEIINTHYQLHRAAADAEYPLFVQLWNETADGCEYAAGRIHFSDFRTAEKWIEEKRRYKTAYA